MAESIKLRLGTRASPLAQWQADWVTARLQELGATVDRVLISTSGDQNQTGAITQFATVGAFTKEIQRALVDRQIDVAVHSLKDLPTEPVPLLALAAIPERGPCGDVLVTLDGRPLGDLPAGARVGTGSLRRRANLWHLRPDLDMLDIRGNVDTRIRKLREGQYDALILAEAGLARLGLAADMVFRIDRETLLPAVGQGALGVEMRAEDIAPKDVVPNDRVSQQENAGTLVQKLDHAGTRSCVLAERALLAKLCAGCLAPVGAYGHIAEDGSLVLSASVLSFDGKQKLIAQAAGPPHEFMAIGEQAAADLLAQGASELIRQAHQR